MLKLRNNTLTNMFALSIVFRFVTNQGVEDRDTTPFRAFIQSDEELIQDGAGDDKRIRCTPRRSSRDMNVCEGSNGVGNDLAQRKR